MSAVTPPRARIRVTACSCSAPTPTTSHQDRTVGLRQQHRNDTVMLNVHTRPRQRLLRDVDGEGRIFDSAAALRRPARVTRLAHDAAACSRRPGRLQAFHSPRQWLRCLVERRGCPARSHVVLLVSRAAGRGAGRTVRTSAPSRAARAEAVPGPAPAPSGRLRRAAQAPAAQAPSRSGADFAASLNAFPSNTGTQSTRSASKSRGSRRPVPASSGGGAEPAFSM